MWHWNSTSGCSNKQFKRFLSLHFKTLCNSKSDHHLRFSRKTPVIAYVKQLRSTLTLKATKYFFWGNHHGNPHGHRSLFFLDLYLTGNGICMTQLGHSAQDQVCPKPLFPKESHIHVGQSPAKDGALNFYTCNKCVLLIRNVLKLTFMDNLGLPLQCCRVCFAL